MRTWAKSNLLGRGTVAAAAAMSLLAALPLAAVSLAAVSLAAVSLAAVSLAAGDAAGETLWSYYDADEGAAPRAPLEPFWYPSFLGAANAAGIANDLGSGHDAWQVRDDSTSNQNPTYETFLSRDPSPANAPNGWRLSATARLVDLYRDGPAMGIIAYFGNRRYGAALGLDADGRLVAEVLGQSIGSQRFTPAGEATGYHDLALQYTPGEAGVAFLFDGVEVVRWDGLPLAAPHPNTFEWGSVGVTQRGAMRFRRIDFELGPFPEPLAGDFNGDGMVDLADFTVWRDAAFQLPANPVADANRDGRVDTADYRAWRDNFGQRSAAAFEVVPEPAAWLLAISAMSRAGVRRRRRGFGRLCRK